LIEQEITGDYFLLARPVDGGLGGGHEIRFDFDSTAIRPPCDSHLTQFYTPTRRPTLPP